MQILYFLEGIRNPVLDGIMYAITQFGDETVFLVVALWLFWCVDKRKGYYILTIGFWGLEINQLLKMIFRVPRPWVLDPEFSIVEMARKGAGGYSFPSGHTQIATGLFGGIARSGEKKSKVFGITMLLLVSFSRMYLGAHTPKDVGVSLVIGTILIFALYPVFFSESPSAEKWIDGIFLLMLLFSLAVTVYIYRIDPQIVDAENLADAMKTTSTVFGALVAVIIGYQVEKRYIHFETKAPGRVQFIKIAGGLLIVLLLKSGLKRLLGMTLLPAGICDMIRYSILVLFVILGWPMIFMRFTAKGER